MSLNLVTAPGGEPLTAAEARLWLSVGAEITDPVLTAFIGAARQMIDGRDGWLGRALNTQTWDLSLNHFAGYWNAPLEKGFYSSSAGGDSDYGCGQYLRRSQRRGIVIPLPPLQSVTSVKYLDTDGVQQTLDPATYVVQKGEPSHIVLANGATWPSVLLMPEAVTIRFVAGYGDNEADVPQPIRLAIALQAKYMMSLASGNAAFNEMTVGLGSASFNPNGSAGIDNVVAALLQNLRVWAP